MSFDDSASEPSAPPGWYPLDGGQERFWDGTSWTDQIRSALSMPPPSGAAVSAGQPVPAMTATDDTTMAVLIHVTAIFTGIIGPIVIWLLRRDQSPFVDHHGREAINFQITLYIAAFVSFILAFILIGFAFLLLIFLAQFILPTLGAVAASKGKDFRYPFTIRLL